MSFCHHSPPVCRSRLDVLTTKLFSKAAPVAAGMKPAMLLRLDDSAPCPYRHVPECLPQHAARCTELDLFYQHQERLLQRLGLDCWQLHRNHNGALLFFFDSVQLQQVLNCQQNQAFLHDQGFTAITVACLKQQLTGRFQTFPQHFPHAIGLFLGYPLKDVEGFVRGDRPVPMAGAVWRVFGDPRESVELMRKVIELEKRVWVFLRNEETLHEMALQRVLRIAA